MREFLPRPDGPRGGNLDQGIVGEATWEDLSPDAIPRAQGRITGVQTSPHWPEEVARNWSENPSFLNKAKLTIDGRDHPCRFVASGKRRERVSFGTRRAQDHLGLKNEEGMEEGYEHFGLPLLLSARAVHAKIRNHKIRVMSDTRLFPDEITKYDPWVIYEALHNCIAHQNYELADGSMWWNIPIDWPFPTWDTLFRGLESVIRRDAPPERYRNPFLAQAMVEINMIDTIGSGIRRMYSKMKQRFFPMPDFIIEMAACGGANLWQDSG